MSDPSSEPEAAAQAKAPEIDFIYYMFDWDDNILHMPTKIHLERRTEDRWEPYPVSTSQFALIRRDLQGCRPINDDWDQAFEDFYDVGRRGEAAFLEDTRSALRPIIEGKEAGGPSFNRFRKALVEGRLFAIITARAHSSRVIREAVEYFVRQVLSPTEQAEMVANLRRFNEAFGEHDAATDEEVVHKYLRLNRYHGVTSPEFQEAIGQAETSGPQHPSQAKQRAIRDFVQHVMNLLGERQAEKPVSVGFSDDDAHNVQSVRRFIEDELAREFPDVRFVVYDTSNPGLRRGRKLVIRGQLELELDHVPDDA